MVFKTIFRQLRKTYLSDFKEKGFTYTKEQLVKKNKMIQKNLSNYASSLLSEFKLSPSQTKMKGQLRIELGEVLEALFFNKTVH